MKEDLKSMSLSQMEQAFSALGEPKFRAKQVFTWLHRGARSFDEMTNLSKPLRAKLDGIYERWRASRYLKRTARSNISGGCPTATAWSPL